MSFLLHPYRTKDGGVMSARITWTKTQWSEKGEVGSVDMFSVDYSTIRGDETPYHLSARLPYQRTVFKGVSVEECKLRAEGVLTSFVRSLGAVWPDDSASPPHTEEQQ